MTTPTPKRVVEDSMCMRCGCCVSVCPQGSITIEKYPVIKEGCTSCGMCTDICPGKVFVREETDTSTNGLVGLAVVPMRRGDVNLLDVLERQTLTDNGTADDDLDDASVLVLRLVIGLDQVLNLSGGRGLTGEEGVSEALGLLATLGGTEAKLSEDEGEEDSTTALDTVDVDEEVLVGREEELADDIGILGGVV